MEKSKVDMFLAMNSGNFIQNDLMMIKEKLEKLDDDKFFLIQGLQFQNQMKYALFIIGYYIINFNVFPIKN